MSPVARRRLLLGAKLAFLVLCGFFAWRVFDGRWAELAPALSRMSYWVGLSALLTVVGLAGTSVVWRAILASYGHPVPWARAAPVFFTGQAAKYVPGSVWSIGIQARLARSMGASPTAVVGTGLLFLATHVASAMVLGGVALTVAEDSPVPTWSAAGVAVAGAAVFHPRVLRRLGHVFAGTRARASVTWALSAGWALSMAAVWCAYAAAMSVLAERHTWSETALLFAAVTLSYAAGVLVVIAPAGLGAREAVFVALMSPSLGLTQATALALVGRLVHTMSDLVLAGLGSAALHAQHDRGT